MQEMGLAPYGMTTALCLHEIALACRHGELRSDQRIPQVGCGVMMNNLWDMHLLRLMASVSQLGYNRSCTPTPNEIHAIEEDQQLQQQLSNHAEDIGAAADISTKVSMPCRLS